MKPRTPDRFERLLDGEKFVMTQEVIKLLRKEHRWVERMVKEHTGPRNRFANQDYENGFIDCAVHILMRLKQRRK